MVSSTLELGLNFKPSYVPKTISKILQDLSEIDDHSDRLLVLNDYLHKHQEELSKVEVFKRELPQCMLLLMDAIETLKEEVTNIKNDIVSESSEKPLMEFLPIKRSHDIQHQESFDKNCREEKNLRVSPSFQICKLNHGEKKQKTTLDTSTIQPFQPGKIGDGRDAILTMKGCSAIRESSLMIATEQTGKDVEEVSGFGGLNLSVNDDQPLNFQSKTPSKPILKNHRRSWTPELHARFVRAMEYLGGPQVATPKLIRDTMKVEGLTNDHIKSHLQKYRLHNRTPPAANADPLEHVGRYQDHTWTSEFYYKSP